MSRRGRTYLCPAVSPDGWCCELDGGHEGEHEAGEWFWSGSSPEAERKADVHGALLMLGRASVKKIREHVNADPSRVESLTTDQIKALLEDLAHEGLVAQDPTDQSVWGEA